MSLPNQRQEISPMGQKNVDNQMVGLVDLGNSSHGKRRKQRSDVWFNFEKYRDEDGKDCAKCNLCQKVFDGSSKKGTTRLKKHFKICQRRRNGGGGGDMPAEASILTNPIAIKEKSVMDQELNHLDMARKIIKQGVSSPNSIKAADIIDVYNEEKVTAANSEVQQEIKLLNGVYDNYGGVVVQMTEPMDSKLFAQLVKSSLVHWKQEGKKGVWIKLPIELVNLVEVAVKEGFWYHHAEPTYLMLAYWIPGGVNTLPANASHRVGVGAFVMNEKREVLVVQENSGRFRGTGIWKFPTGVVDQGEDICKAVVREVKEETSIDAEFVEVLAFRQSHLSFFEKSDLFFMCMMRPLSFDIQKQETEIEAAQWMPLEEYMAQTVVQQEGILKYIIDICLAKIEAAYSGFSPVPTTLTFSDQNSLLYYNAPDLKHSNIQL